MNYGFIFIVLIVMVVVSAISVYNTTSGKRCGRIKRFSEKTNKFLNLARVRSAFWSVFILAIIASILSAFVSMTSYSSYMDILTFESCEYRQSYSMIIEYDKRLSTERGKQSEITDLKFQGLQQELSKILSDHKSIVIAYNKLLTNKRIMARNPFVGCLIFDAPADKKILPLIPSEILNQ